MSVFKWDTFKKVIAELVIVFVGVFLAFQLNNYKEDVTNDKLRKRFYKLMLSDFKLNLKEVKYCRSTVNKMLEEFKQKNNKGLKPELSIIPVDISNNLLVLKSAFNSGHLENLDHQYVISLSNGSNYVNRASALIKQFITNEVKI